MNHVRECIHDRTMKPDTWYSAYQLSEQLGISRSPVREGLLRLEEAGLIKFSRNRGFQIIEPQPADVAEIFALRLGIEPAAAARAARDISPAQVEELKSIFEKMQTAMKAGDESSFFEWDRALHDAILAAGHCRRARDILEKLRTHSQLLADSTVRHSRSLKQVHDEHHPIISAIENGDPATARKAMELHIRATGRLLLEQTVQRKNTDLPEDAVAKQADEIWHLYADTE